MPSVIKNAMRALIFLGGLLLILYLLSKVFIPAEGTIDDGIHTENSNGIYEEAENSIDVIFLGDSIVYSAVSPLQIWNDHGITSYCCSTSAQKLWYSQDMLKKAFKNQSPKIVMMETDALFTKFNFDDSVLHKAESVLPILQYHDRWKVLAKNTFDDREEAKITNEYKGYRLYYVSDPSSNLNYMKQKLDNESVPARNRSYFKEIKSYCEEHGAKLILFSCPTTKHWNQARHNNVAKFSKDLGVDYIDLNTMQDKIKINWKKDTRDKGDHLNYFGAVKITDYLGKYLSELGVLTDHRNDDTYESWNIASQKFISKTQKYAKSTKE